VGESVRSAASAEGVPEELPVPPEASSQVATLGDIPEAPIIPPSVEELVETLPLSGEPTFASLGLGGWSPVGIVQNCMEYLHIGCDLPWWTSVIIGNIDWNEDTFVQ
jgi:YidC/Oxa1 family membrane protein insertase